MTYAAKNGTCWLACLVCLVCAAAPAAATDVERRDYAILVDGKEAGTSRMTITVQDDGTTVMSGSCSVKVTKLVLDFTFQIESTEWWKDGKLIGIKSKSNDNGKRREISGAFDGTHVRLKAGSTDKLVRPDIWTTSYWKLADAKYHNNPVPLIDPEDGREYNGQLTYIATEQLTVSNGPQNCYRFRVTGGKQTIDLWYDRYHRLVRQEFVEQGHRVIVHLLTIQR